MTQKKEVIDVAALPSNEYLSLAVAGSLTPSRPGGGGPGRLNGHTRGPGHAKSPRPQGAAQAVRPHAPGGGEDGEHRHRERASRRDAARGGAIAAPRIAHTQPTGEPVGREERAGDGRRNASRGEGAGHQG